MKNTIIPLDEYIELLEFKLMCLLEAYKKDSSWNYGIEELQEKIQKLKDQLQ